MNSVRDKLPVAIIGATGAVGRIMIEELERLQLPILPQLFASPRSAGQVLYYENQPIKVKAYSFDEVKNLPFALMSAGSHFSRQESPKLVESGVTIIDNSSAWRMDPQVSLIVPEVNIDSLHWQKNQGCIIANPNCSTIQLVVTLKPLKDQFGINRLHVATYQSVSGAGWQGISELQEQIKSFKCADEIAHIKPQKFAQPIVGNLIPAIDVLDPVTGHCFEEEKMVRESRKILGDPQLNVLATTVRVPTFYGHGEAVWVELKKPVDRAQLVQCFQNQPGLQYVDDEGNAHKLPTPIKCHKNPMVFVSRLRLPLGQTQSNEIQYWNISDNLYKGAATNAVQILKYIFSHKL